MRFELSLVQSGVVDPGSLCEALEKQMAERPPLGQVAIEEGYLSARQVRDVLRRQRESDDNRFGEVAWDLGLLTLDQVARLLMAQTERQRSLAEHLIELGAITRERVEDELQVFRHGDASLGLGDEPAPTPSGRGRRGVAQGAGYADSAASTA